MSQGRKDISKLIKKKVPNKKGHLQTVYVKRTEVEDSKEKNQSGELGIELYRKVKRKGKGEGKEISLTEKELNTLLRHGKIGMVSAGINPKDKEDEKLSVEQIEERYGRLKQDLVNEGYMFVRVAGRYEGKDEDTYMVMINDIDKKNVEALGTKYNQDSVIYSEEGNNQMIYTTGEDKGKSYRGSGYENLSPDAKDNFTELTTASGKKVKFSLTLNWDKLEKGFGKKDYSKLTKKKITDKTGKQRTVWVKLGEAKESAKKKTKEWVEKQKKQYDDKGKEADAKKEDLAEEAVKIEQSGQVAGLVMPKDFGSRMGGTLRAKGRAMMKGIKSEVHEWKEAGSGIKKLAMGRQLTDHEKKAIRDVAIHVGMVAAMAIPAVAGEPELSVGAKAGILGKKLALGYLEHAGILRGGHALLFGKGMDEQLDDGEAEHYIERMIFSMAKYMEEQNNAENQGE